MRNRSIGTKVTEEEYVRLESCAAEAKQSLSEWSREALLRAADDRGHGEQTILAEVLALRSILLNLFFKVSQGQAVPAEEMKSIIERADSGKLEKALAKLQPSQPEKTAAAVNGSVPFLNAHNATNQAVRS